MGEMNPVGGSIGGGVVEKGQVDRRLIVDATAARIQPAVVLLRRRRKGGMVISRSGASVAAIAVTK